MAKNFKILHEQLRAKMTDEQKYSFDEKIKNELEKINTKETKRQINYGFMQDKNFEIPTNFDRMNEEEIFKLFTK